MTEKAKAAGVGCDMVVVKAPATGPVSTARMW